MTKEVSKLRENPLVINCYKPVNGEKGIFKNDSTGKIKNEWQPIKYVTFLNFTKMFPGVIAMGYNTFELAKIGDFQEFESEIKEILFPVSEQDKKYKEDNALRLQAEKQQEQIKKQQEQIDALLTAANGGNTTIIPETNNDNSEDIEIVREQYLEVIGKKVANIKANDIDWMKEKIQTELNK